MTENIRSICLMVLAMTSFAINDTIMKLLMQNLNMSQAVLLRGAVATVLLYLLTWRAGPAVFRQSRSDWHRMSYRTLADIVSTLSFFAALIHMPIANLSAVVQFSPLAVTLAAAVFLQQPIGWRRLLAIALGFAGVLLIIKPGTQGFSIWSVLGLVTVAAVVVRDLSTRQMSAHVPSSLVAFVASVAVTLTGLAGVLLIEGWSPVAPHEMLLILGAACCIVTAYLSVVAAMRVGDVATVAPFRYSQLLSSIFCGWLVFGELPDGWGFVGAALIVAGGVFTIWRGATRSGASRTAA